MIALSDFIWFWPRKEECHQRELKSPEKAKRPKLFDTAGMSQKYHSRIYVTLRPSVLDPAGTAVESGLKELGYQGVEQVRIGKYIELTLTATDETDARTRVDRMCDRLLANPVIENYRFELTPLV